MITQEVRPGLVYRHHSGRVYTVIDVTNTSHPSEKFPPTVHYVGANGQRWSRPLDQFCEKFDVLYDGTSRSDLEAEFQYRVKSWLIECFGREVANDRAERNHRFLEEALELVQSTGCTRDEALQLVDYVYSRPVGDPRQEVGGVMTTLAALCCAHGFDMYSAAETELARVWTKIDKIRAKHAAKPRNSPLPGNVSTH